MEPESWRLRQQRVPCSHARGRVGYVEFAVRHDEALPAIGARSREPSLIGSKVKLDAAVWAWEPSLFTHCRSSACEDRPGRVQGQASTVAISPAQERAPTAMAGAGEG